MAASVLLWAYSGTNSTRLVPCGVWMDLPMSRPSSRSSLTLFWVVGPDRRLTLLMSVKQISLPSAFAVLTSSRICSSRSSIAAPRRFSEL